MATLTTGCVRDVPSEPVAYRQATAFVLDWNNLLLELERFTPGYRAPVSARMFAYVELTGYEAAWPALKNYAAAGTFCPGYAAVDPRSIPADYSLPAGLTAAYAQACRDFFPNTPQKYRDKIDQLEVRHLNGLRLAVPAEVLRHSAIYGQQVARSVWNWSATDPAGHNGFLYNYDQHYTPPQSEGLWRSASEHAMPALLPNWGQ
ncbi:MAG: hypothetical protein ABIQ93_17250, partial [Saprospiraceae bacterium]